MRKIMPTSRTEAAQPGEQADVRERQAMGWSSEQSLRCLYQSLPWSCPSEPRCESWSDYRGCFLVTASGPFLPPLHLKPNQHGSLCDLEGEPEWALRAGEGEWKSDDEILSFKIHFFWQNYRDGEQTRGCQWLGTGSEDIEREGDGCDYKRIARRVSVVMEQFCLLNTELVYKSTHNTIT